MKSLILDLLSLTAFLMLGIMLFLCCIPNYDVVDERRDPLDSISKTNTVKLKHTVAAHIICTLIFHSFLHR
jgi:uncharacterized membrane protein YqhA